MSVQHGGMPEKQYGGPIKCGWFWLCNVCGTRSRLYSTREEAALAAVRRFKGDRIRELEERIRRLEQQAEHDGKGER